MQDSFPKSDLMQECVERVNLPKRLCGRIAETDMETHRKMHFHSNGFSATRLRDSELQGTTGYERYLPVLRLRNKYYKTCICRFLLQRPIRIWSNCFNYFDGALPISNIFLSIPSVQLLYSLAIQNGPVNDSANVLWSYETIPSALTRLVKVNNISSILEYVWVYSFQTSKLLVSQWRYLMGYCSFASDFSTYSVTSNVRD